jgi:hypothetical protein
MSIEVRRLRIGGWLVLTGGLALFVFVFFFDWYGDTVSGLPAGVHISGANIATTGWDTFTSNRWIWLATIVAALAFSLATAADYSLDSPLPPAWLVAALGALSSALIVYRIAHHPSATLTSGQLHASYGLRSGIWLGLIASVAVAAGACLQAKAPSEVQAAEPAAPEQAFSGLTVAPAEPSSSAKAEPTPASKSELPSASPDGPPPGSPAAPPSTSRGSEGAP